MAATETGCDVIVIGGGIAGASVAAELAASARVVLLEREDRPGYHTTGRSAAIYSRTYGPPVIRALSRASAAFLEDPARHGLTHPLLGQRGVLLIGRPDQAEALAAMEAGQGGALRPVSVAEARTRLPLLRPEYLGGALFDPTASDIDVDALHGLFLRRFREGGGDLRTRAEVTALSREGNRWRVSTPKGDIRADIVVNASGAWADRVARLAGVAPVGLVPKRRTALIVAAPDGVEPGNWPMAVDIDEAFYLKPEAGKLLISPADETPSEPCDAQPEELDIAICVDRIERAFALSVRRIEHRWAGLRSFVADKSPVAGFAPEAPGFFWLAGQGGYGIQTSPALGRAAAALALGRPLPDDIVAAGVTAAALAPGRLPTPAS